VKQEVAAYKQAKKQVCKHMRMVWYSSGTILLDKVQVIHLVIHHVPLFCFNTFSLMLLGVMCSCKVKFTGLEIFHIL
jgi:hypothetical protein